MNRRTTPTRRATSPAPRPSPAKPQAKEKKRYPTTPDGRYFVVGVTLWRCTNPSLSPEARTALTRRLMDARRAVGVALRADDADAERRARRRVNAAKVALGERGKPWWPDGAPDYNRHKVTNTPYATWFAGLVDRPVPAPRSPKKGHRSST